MLLSLVKAARQLELLAPVIHARDSPFHLLLLMPSLQSVGLGSTVTDRAHCAVLWRKIDFTPSHDFVPAVPFVCDLDLESCLLVGKMGIVNNS